MTGSECQDICSHVSGAKQFSHYNEGHHAEHGFCGCFSQCWPTSAGCHDKCATHEVFSAEELVDGDEDEDEEELDSSEVFGGEVDVEREKQPRPGPRYCHCMHGPMTPDADSCDFP